MDADRFDTLTRLLGASGSRRKALGAGLACLATTTGFVDAGAKRKQANCPHGKKKCGKKCIPKRDCCKDGDCAPNQRCEHGACVDCVPQGTACTNDDQCCTGICDKYTNRCQQVRVSCENGESCPNGRCCDVFGKQCLYEKATQGACEPHVSCGYLLCGDKCSDLSDGTYQFCGYEGSGACRNGKCCCPKGVPLAACPNLGPGGGNLPRCP
ncbi:MAG TPA: hypothetical protein VFU81_19905 [Thermomicrobiales bacterium]|nr:hypothetical protein [Thermomicrobiales bacterium]